MVTLAGSNGAELVGLNYTLTCQIVGGTTAPTYRWFKDGNIIPSQTSSTFMLTYLLVSDSGSYMCEGMRDNMSATSANVVLAVSSKYHDNALYNYVEASEFVLPKIFSQFHYHLHNHSSLYQSLVYKTPPLLFPGLSLLVMLWTTTL